MNKVKNNLNHKKKTIKTAVAVHLTIYLVICIILTLLNVPATVVFAVMMVLLWGLLVLGYAYYYEK